MIDGPRPRRPWRGGTIGSSTATVLCSPAILQAATPTPGVGPAEVLDAWPTVVRFGWFLGGAAAFAALGLFVLRPAIVRLVRRRNRNNPTLTEAIGRYVGAAVLVVSIFVGGTVAGYGGLLGGSALVIAAATLAIGVAGQTVVGSIISGMALVVDPEFGVGTYISWPEGEGTVRSITLRVTRILTPDGELVTVPNTVLASQTITRPFSRGRLRTVERVEVAYDTDLASVLPLLETVAADVDGVLESPPPTAYVEELGADGVAVSVYYWIGDPTRRDVLNSRSAVRQSIKRRLAAAEVTVNPPAQRELGGRIALDDTQ